MFKKGPRVVKLRFTLTNHEWEEDKVFEVPVPAGHTCKREIGYWAIYKDRRPMRIIHTQAGYTEMVEYIYENEVSDE